MKLKDQNINQKLIKDQNNNINNNNNLQSQNIINALYGQEKEDKIVEEQNEEETEPKLNSTENKSNNINITNNNNLEIAKNPEQEIKGEKTNTNNNSVQNGIEFNIQSGQRIIRNKRGRKHRSK